MDIIKVINLILGNKIKYCTPSILKEIEKAWKYTKKLKVEWKDNKNSKNTIIINLNLSKN
jgi:hypothetical protein